MVPKAEIKENGYDLSINRYKEIVYEEVIYDPPQKILSDLKALEAEIQDGLAELERFLFESGEVHRNQFEAAFGKQESLSVFIRSLIGLDREAVKKAFSKFLDDTRFNTSQIRFVEMIIDHLTQKGVMDAGLLYEQPFTGIHYEGLDGVFPGAAADEIVQSLKC